MLSTRFAHVSLLRRVLAGVLFLLVIGGFFVAIAAFAYGQQAARLAYDRLLLGAANDIAESISVVDGRPLADVPVSAFALLALAPDDRIAYAVRGPDDDLLTGHPVARSAPPARLRGGAPAFVDAQMQGDPARFVTVVRRLAERDYSGAVTVTVGQTTGARRAAALELTLNALLVTGAAGVALLVIAFVVIRTALAPLDRIAGGLMQRDPYDLTPVEAELPSDLAVMVHAMNRFMLRLDRQVNAMRNLISDAAHQLRTPVAAIRAQAELATEETDPDRHQQSLERLVRRTRSLGHLLDQMLSRALVIHRTDSATRELVDLRDVALELVESRDFEVLSPGSELGLDISDTPVLVLADHISLGEAGKNLLSNALRHGASPVRIGAGLAGGKAVLWIEDAGQGPADDILGRIGQRFERSAASRGDSAGLGLSIVVAVAEAFGGTVEMARNDSGFRMSLVLPAQRSE